MARFTILVLLLMINGCSTVTSEFYSPVVKNSEKLSIGSCGHRYESFIRELDDGVHVEILEHLIIFRLKKDASIKFITEDVKFFNLDTKEAETVNISEITTGKFLTETETKLYDLKPIKFMPLQEFASTGQYENIDMKWGEWSPWKSKEDVFRVKLSKYLEFKPGGQFTIELPSFYVNGLVAKVEPIKFIWKKQKSLSCLQ